ncbi:MAG TPA: AAA family ATPase, partial [Polyangiales bacterium]
KQTVEITPPRELVASVPPELDALCCALLARDPMARPSSEQMRALRNELAARDAGRPSAVLSARGEAGFVGRGDVLAELERLYGEAQRRPVLALVRGESGLGKSELLRTFTTALTRTEDPFIVRGRCYEREAVPYKALDEAIDDLTRILMRLPDEQAHQLVPRHAQTLTRLFPVLLRVPAFRDAVHGRQSGSEGHLQRLGSGALRELLARIADRRPLVLVIDDLQWSDVDSLRLLADALAPPDPPNVFVVGTCRSRHAAPALDDLLSLPGLLSAPIDLAPLTHVEAVELALSALPGNTEDAYEVAERIARESGGSPLWVLELAGGEGERTRVLGADSLDWLIQQRLAALTPDARKMLELASLTGRPLPREVLVRACGEVSYPTALAALRAKKLVHRTGATTGEEALEPYHDQVRRAVLKQLDPALAAQHHDTLARALEDTGHSEPEWLAQHLQAAGRAAEAHHYALQAARKAMQALAFNRAADLFALALELAGEGSTALHREHGAALACAGRGVEAADSYLCAARTAPPADAALLEGLAAAQRLRVGHVEQAVALLRRVLARNDLPWPETFAECIARFLLNRARIRLSGLKFTLRDEREIPRQLLDKLDALYPAQTALGTFDYLRGACFASMALPLALEAGEPKRLVTALATEAVYNVMLDGSAGMARARNIQSSIDVVSSAMRDPYGAAVAELTSALCSYWSGRWARVVGPAQKAEHVFSQDVSDGTWEAALVRSVRHTVEIHAGALPQLAQEVPSALLDASERNDRYAQLDLMRSMVVVHLRDDRVDEARAMLREMEALLARFPVVSLHHLVMAVNVSFELYVGDGRRAKALLASLWESCRRCQLHRFPLLRLTHLGTRADCALADPLLSAGERAEELLAIARAARKEPVEWGAALAQHLTGEALLIRGKPELAMRTLDEAHDAYATSGHALAAACIRAAQSSCAP